MAYKIAVASSDGKQVDLHFGGAAFFHIYDVADDGSFTAAGRRSCPPAEAGGSPAAPGPAGCGAPGSAGSGCGAGGCAPAGAACGGQGGGYGAAGPSARVELLADVRAVVAAKIGFNVTKQLEKKAISGFDVDCTVQEALTKITKYFYSVDNHVPLARR